MARIRVLLILCIVACGLALVEVRLAYAINLPSNFTEQLFVSGLNIPTSMAFAPDGRLFVTEQTGGVRVVKNDVLLPTPFVTLTVDANNERGLLGLAIDPQFTTNQYIYVYHTMTTTPRRNRVSRFTANGDVAAAGSEFVVMDMDALGGATNHNGGALHFGSDGKLYIAVGDNANTTFPQSLETRHGKMLRINKDGSIPTDNPYYTTATGLNRAIWAIGLRNPFTFAVEPGTGKVYINDVGQNSWEEINLGRPGANYGWPATEGYTTNPLYDSPLFAYPHSGGPATDTGCAIGAGVFYRPTVAQFPSSYVGKYFFGDYCNHWIKVYDQATNTVANFATDIGNDLVDLDVGPEGSLYFMIHWFGEIRRIDYTPGAQPPVITENPASQTVAVGQSATFACAATGATPLSYQWQRGGSNIPGATGTSYTLSGATAGDNGAQFRCVATNTFGSATSNSATLTVTANQPPVVSITAPTSGTLYSGGDAITFTGTATDPETGPLPASAYTWKIDLHHAIHTHPALPLTSGITTGTLNIARTGHSEDLDVFYRITLTATDPAGLQTTVTRDVQPRLSSLRLETDPPGLTLNLNGSPRTTPHNQQSVASMTHNLDAPTQVAGSVTYAFQSWSDGGAKQHDVDLPATATTYTATFFGIDTPVQNGPSGLVNGTLKPTYQWQKVSGATDYVLFVKNFDTGATAINTVYSAASACPGAATTCSVTPDTALVNSEDIYGWWVAAFRSGTWGLWSAGKAFLVSAAPAKPTNIAPVGAVVVPSPAGFNPTFRWSHAEGAIVYALAVYDLQTNTLKYFTTFDRTQAAYASMCTATECAATPTGTGTTLENGRTYGFFVAGVSYAAVGPWSDGSAFVPYATPGVPTLVGPSGAVTPRPNFRWNAVTGATDYYLLVLNAAGNVALGKWISGAAACVTNPCGYTLTVAEALATGTYNWFMLAGNPAGVSAYSTGRTITVGASAPAPTATFGGFTPPPPAPTFQPPNR